MLQHLLLITAAQATTAATASDAGVDGFKVFQFVFSAIVSIVLLWVGIAVRRYDGVESRLNSALTRVADDRHELTQKLVDERMRSMTHQLDNHVNHFSAVVQAFTIRLKESENGLDGLSDRGHKIELAVADKVDQIKDLIRDAAKTTATKQDLREHEQQVSRRDEAMQSRLQKVESSVSELAVASRAGPKRGQ